MEKQQDIYDVKSLMQIRREKLKEITRRRKKNPNEIMKKI